MIATVDSNPDMKLKVQYSSDVFRFCFDPDYARNPKSVSRVSRETMYSRLKLPNEGERLTIMQPLIVYSVTLTEEDLEKFSKLYPEYTEENLWEADKTYLAVRDGNTRLDALLYGVIDKGEEYDPIPYIQLTKDQVSDPLFMAMIPLALNESKEMSPYDKAQGYAQYVDALFEAYKEENADLTESEVRNLAREEFLKLFSDVSSSTLESALLIAELKNLPPVLVEYLDRGQISLTNAKYLVGKADSYKKEGSSIETVLDRASKRAIERGSTMEILEASGEVFLQPHVMLEDLKIAIQHYADIRSNKKAEAKLLEERDNVPEQIRNLVEQENLSPDTAIKLTQIATDANLEPEVLIEPAKAIAAEKLGKPVEEVTFEDLKPTYVNKAKTEYLKALEKQNLEDEDSVEASENGSESKKRGRPKTEYTATDYAEELASWLTHLQAIEWDSYRATVDHPNLVVTHQEIGKIIRIMNKLKPTN